MAREGIEITGEVLDVDLHVGHGLSAVDQNGDAPFFGHGDHFTQRIDGPDCVGNVSESDESSPLSEHGLKDLKVDVASWVDGGNTEVSRSSLAQHLPGNDVRMVFKGRDENFIAGIDIGIAPRTRHEIDGLSRVSHEDDLSPICGVKEALHLIARSLIELGCFCRQSVHTSVDVGVRVGVEV